jgi:hypothetical protein
MNELGRPAADAAPEPAALRARIAALRDVAARVDPVRLRYLEALEARVAVQTAPVRELLCEKLAAAVAECERRCAAEPVAPRKRSGAAACAPLAQLNHSIRAKAPGAVRGVAASDELASVRRFRRAWLGGRAQEQVQRAVGRRPANAGPLNSHALVLESLEIMSRLSPDYLRRFVAHVQTLQWLDQTSADEALSAKAAPRARKASPRAARRK